MKRISYHSINLTLLIPFVMVLFTVFIVSKDLANGIVVGKHFWFYLSMMLISAAEVVSFCINRKKVFFTISDLLIAIFCFSGLIITYIHNEGISNKSVLLLLVVILYFYFRIFFVQYRWNKYILILFFLVTGFIEAVWGLKQLYGFSPSQHHLFKTTGSFFNPGPYAGYLAMIVPLTFYYILNDYRVFKNIFHRNFIPFYARWSVSSLTFLGIFLVLPATMSRASWVASFSGCLVSVLLYLSKNGKLTNCIRSFRKKTPFILPGIILLSVIALFGIYHLKKDSADGRLLTWKISTRVIMENPLGVGLGNFSGVYGDKQAEYFSGGKGTEQEQLVAGNPEYAFNEYLQICIEFGIIPFLLFLFIILCTVYSAIKKKNHASAGAFIALLVFASMSYPFSVLPFLISFMFLSALCLSDGQQIKPRFRVIPFRTPSFRRSVIFTVILFLVTCVSIYGRYPLYEAYRRWNRSKIIYNAGLYGDASKEYAEIYPYLYHEIQFLFEYAQSLSKSGQFGESNRVLKKAVKISCDPMLYNIMGKNHQALGKYKLAEQYFKKAAMTVPSRLYPWYLLAKLYDETGDREKVFQMAEIIQHKEPKVHSTAIEEMRNEIKSMCEKYNESREASQTCLSLPKAHLIICKYKTE